MPDTIAETRARLMRTMRDNAVFDGWGEAAFHRALAETGIDADTARLACPRGSVDVALEFHFAGDRDLADLLAGTDLSALRYSDRVARAVEMRLDVMAADREAVRKASAFFALPQNAGDGARAVWHTADTIWTGLGDSSRDVNWYSKRAILSAVWSSVVLYWLGDESPGFAQTSDFIARRIGNVMTFEKFKGRFRDSPLGKAFARGPGRLLDRIEAPGSRSDLPGRSL